MIKSQTLIGVQGNSGKAEAKAHAPAWLVRLDRPTKNSLPKKRVESVCEMRNSANVGKLHIRIEEG